MPNNSHREAEALAAEAAGALAEGRSQEGVDLYLRAALLEETALSQVPETKVRTRSILSVSVASLLYKAGLFQKAERRIYQMLGSTSLEEWAERQLRELLQVVLDEAVVVTNLRQRYSGESFTVALRGGEIGSGTGPLDLILEKGAAFRSLIWRFAEWIGDYPLRLSGNPPKELTSLIQSRASEPAIGSYRLQIRLTEPLQLDMFDAPKVQPKEVSDAMFDFLSIVNKGTAQQLEGFVRQPDYRRALLELVRNVAPSGKRITEIGIYRQKPDSIQAVYLTDALSKRIRDFLPRRPRDQKKPRRELKGVLRALHLDRHWLEITKENGEPERCDTVHHMLDDVVGPMVNRCVIVSGTVQQRRGRETLLLEEIELADDQ